jgi:hypothetical protein
MRKLNRKLSIAAVAMALVPTATLADEKQDGVPSWKVRLQEAQPIEDLSRSVLHVSYDEDSDSDEETKTKKIAQQNQAKTRSFENTTSKSAGFWGRVEAFFAPITKWWNNLVFVR